MRVIPIVHKEILNNQSKCVFMGVRCLNGRTYNGFYLKMAMKYHCNNWTWIQTPIEVFDFK